MVLGAFLILSPFFESVLFTFRRSSPCVLDKIPPAWPKLLRITWPLTRMFYCISVKLHWQSCCKLVCDWCLLITTGLCWPNQSDNRVSNRACISNVPVWAKFPQATLTGTSFTVFGSGIVWNFGNTFLVNWSWLQFFSAYVWYCLHCNKDAQTFLFIFVYFWLW